MRLLMIIALCALTITASAQVGTKPPAEVRKNFILKYPDAAIQNWELVENVYKADYKRQGMQYYALYTPKGEWVETWTMVDVVKVPLPVREAIRTSNYSTWPVDNVSKVELPKQVYVYRYRFTKDGDTRILTVNEAGEILQ